MQNLVYHEHYSLHAMSDSTMLFNLFKLLWSLRPSSSVNSDVGWSWPLLPMRGLDFNGHEPSSSSVKCI
jgi:hypothetical protein